MDELPVAIGQLSSPFWGCFVVDTCGKISGASHAVRRSTRRCQRTVRISMFRLMLLLG